MGIYEGFKDAISIAQKADNVDLYKRLLDLSAQALDMQEEIRQLKEENAELKKGRDLESRIIRHPENFLTLEGESEDIRYCPVCWGNEHKLIQLNLYDDEYCRYVCIKCKNNGIYDHVKRAAAIARDEEERSQRENDDYYSW